MIQIDKYFWNRWFNHQVDLGTVVSYHFHIHGHRHRVFPSCVDPFFPWQGRQGGWIHEGFLTGKLSKKPWLFMVYGGWNPTQLYGDYFINHEIRIPSLTNQDSMESRSFFFRGSPRFFFKLHDASRRDDCICIYHLGDNPPAQDAIVTTMIIIFLVGDPELSLHLPLLLGGGQPNIYIYIYHITIILYIF